MPVLDSNEIDEILAVDKEKKRDKDNEQVVELFRKVFSTPDGEKVLRQILIDLKYFDECITDSDVSLNNYAKFMLKERLEIRSTMRITAGLINAGSNIVTEV